MSSTTFIYALCEPGTRTVRYIGKADNPSKRYQMHLLVSIKHKNHLGNWLSRLNALGTAPAMFVLREVLMDDWKKEERRYIRLAKALGMDLVNATDGGEGCFNPSPETRAKMGAAARQSQTGRIATAATRAKMSASSKGRDMRPAWEAARTPEALAKMRAALKGGKMPPRTPEHRANLSRALKGRVLTPEWKAKIGATQKGRRPSDANLAALKTPEARSKRIASFKLTWERKRAEKLAQAGPT